jgi:hypothetical protein
MNRIFGLLKFRRPRIGTFLAVTMVALLPACVAAAEQRSDQKSALPVPAGRLLPLKGAATGNSCAAFGPGFIKIDGTDTCVKVGGAVSIGAGISSGSR